LLAGGAGAGAGEEEGAGSLHSLEEEEEGATGFTSTPWLFQTPWSLFSLEEDHSEDDDQEDEDERAGAGASGAEVGPGTCP